jgi:hypothetical protein
LKNPNYGKEMEESRLEYEAWNNTYHVLLTVYTAFIDGILYILNAVISHNMFWSNIDHHQVNIYKENKHRLMTCIL